MAHPTGESESDALRLDFDRHLKLEFHGSNVTSDAGLLPFRELDDALALTEMAGAVLSDGRRGKNTRHVLSGLLRQSVFGRLAACAGLQSRQLHADVGSARDGQAVVADEPAGKTREHRRQGRVRWPLRHLPDGRGRGAEGIVPGNLTADRRTATKTRPSVATGGRMPHHDGRSASGF